MIELILTLLVIGTLGATMGAIVQGIELGASLMDREENLIDLMENPIAQFDGETIEAEDGERLSKQLERVYFLMRDGRWRTLEEIAGATGDSMQSVSARLRDLRKPKFGGHTVERDRLGRGLFAYRLKIEEAEAA